MTEKPVIGVLGTYEWNFEHANQYLAPAATLVPIATQNDLVAWAVSGIHCDWMFVPHWRHIIGPNVLNFSRFVGFHLGRLPNDRGGSPIQHQILRGEYESELCAVELDEGVDSGRILMRRPFSLAEGTLKELLEDASRQSAEMMLEIIRTNPVGVEQQQGGRVNSRRTAAMSEIPALEDPRHLYDFIRMLDCPGYPNARMRTNHWQLSFTKARIVGTSVVAEVTFIKDEVIDDWHPSTSNFQLPMCRQRGMN